MSSTGSPGPTVLRRLAGWLDRGQLLVLAGVLLCVGSLGPSAALAPDLGVGGDSGRETVVGVQGGGHGWHRFGRVTMYEGRSVAWRATAADSYFDVTTTDGGTVLAGFMDGGRTDCGPYDAPCTRTGFQRIDPDATGGPAVVHEYGFPVRTATNSEVHDVEPLGNGSFLLTDMERERVFVVRRGTVVWQWNAGRLYDAPADPTRTDWLHVNDVDVIEPGRYLVSVRNANQLLVVERGRGVVEIINRDTASRNDGTCARWGKQLRDTDGDGEIRCGDPTVLSHQHNPQWLGDGAVLVADSGNDRVVELRRTGNGTWEPAWTLTRADGVALRWPRDADRLPNGHTLVTDTRNRRILEITPAGEVVWSIRTEYVPYEADRVPVGEPPSGPRYDGGRVARSGHDVPVLSTFLVGIRSVWPGLPFWVRELQLAATLCSAVLVLAGTVDHWR